MKCRCGHQATWTHKAPWAASGVEGLCDHCAVIASSVIDRRQAQLEQRRPRRIP